MQKNAIVARVIAIVLGLVFIGAGLSKLSAQPMMLAEFAAFGYPTWFMYLTGLLEIVAAVMLFVARTRTIGALLIVCIMIGAIASHVTHGQFVMAVAPVVLLALALVLGWLQGWSFAKPPVAANP